ncbi:Metalloproteases (zincins), catalytic [Glarea lozoyensis ATCC 20868]|uniref:Metalloproteases (Zincins), catalytic n=1 Tax=Glarea lozoyensis (strain ATCC 20868 / MF5171) TaxID=1116229 RepID=S3D3U8_GLAL2|nr:Metalloproteases (zincins), catalytic [Glarea lozoyensis ATCC 20868]EPE33152.1 Metalloproteases (zincins), catalytic [Glarea lozoyensis ATCC 20868]
MPTLVFLVSAWLAFILGGNSAYITTIETRQDPGFRLFMDGYTSIYIDPECNDVQEGVFHDAWEDAKLLSKAQFGNVDGHGDDKPHKMWLGDSWNKRGSRYNAVTNERTGDIYKNIWSMKSLFDNQGTEENERIYWWCQDIRNECNEANIYGGYFKTTENIPQPDGPENFQYNTAMTVLHEAYHYQNLVCDPPIDDHAWGAIDCYNLAHTYGTKKAYLNADSYALDALAVYLQQTFNTEVPPAPEQWLDHFMPVTN